MYPTRLRVLSAFAFLLLTTVACDRGSLAPASSNDDAGVPGGGGGSNTGAGGAISPSTGGAGGAISPATGGAAGSVVPGSGGRQPTDGPPPIQDAGPADVPPGNQVVSLEAFPRALDLYVNQSATVQALATLADGRRGDPSLQIEWSIADTSVAQLFTTTGRFARVRAVSLGTTMLIARCQGVTTTVPVRVLAPQLLGLTVEPDHPGAGVGETVDLRATTEYSYAMGEDVTDKAMWTADAPAVASVSGGHATCRTVGQTTVTASYMGVSGMALLSCSPHRDLIALSLQPDQLTLTVGDESEFTAFAVYSDGSAVDVSDRVTLASSDRKVATENGSFVHAEAPGSAMVTVSFGGKSVVGTVQVSGVPVPVGLRVDPAMVIIAPGNSLDLVANLVFKDGHLEQVDMADGWSSSNEMVVAVNAFGNVMAYGVGKATITVKAMGFSATASVVVAEAKLTGLRVTPGMAHLRAGEYITLLAEALYADGNTQDVTDQVLWASSDPKVAAVQREGANLIAVGAGSATVTAYYMGLQATVAATVDASRPQRLLLSPTSVVLAPGESEMVQAVLAYDDGGSRDVSGEVNWETSSTNVVEVDAGNLNAMNVGVATVTARFGNLSATVSVRVTTAGVKALVVTPNPGSVPAGQRLQLTAVAQLDDGSSRDVTDRATWATSAPDVALVSNALTSRGQVTGVATGKATITATYQSSRASADVSVP